jgi:hypothetical protein
MRLIWHGLPSIERNLTSFAAFPMARVCYTDVPVCPDPPLEDS